MPEKKPNPEALDKIVQEARTADAARSKGYRQQALKLFPWICGRCAREFAYENLQELTVHHRDHNHDNNPSDGSNWELLCLYCHDNEHQRIVDQAGDTIREKKLAATHTPFADLASLLEEKPIDSTQPPGKSQDKN